MLRCWQYVPAAQTEIVLVSLQKDPAGHGLSLDVPGGQYPPALQVKEVSELPGQYFPAGQITGNAAPPAHVKPGRQKAQTVFDVRLHTLVLYWPTGHTLQIVHAVAPETLEKVTVSEHCKQ